MKRLFLFLFSIFFISIATAETNLGAETTVALPCFVDFDVDLDVDGLDLTWFAQAYAVSDLGVDLNNDGVVNQDDVEIFASEFGRTDC